jgi:hypothetical protein
VILCRVKIFEKTYRINAKSREALFRTQWEIMVPDVSNVLAAGKIRKNRNGHMKRRPKRILPPKICEEPGMMKESAFIMALRLFWCA